jgi:mono/diheme cytochrome c family protein
MMRLALALSLAGAAGAADLFTEKVQPILAARCIACHAPGVKINDFDLTTREALLKGGKSGAAVAPGDAASSRLYQYVAAGKMPPDRRLDDAQVAAIKEWIDAGAAWGPAASIAVTRPRAGLDWWALQPPRKPEVPRVAGATNPIDAFLLAKLRSHGLDFAPRADHRTLIRRLSFDLAGLPPAPEELKRSYEEQVERLLASPHYGERWGRHWLDIVRFGESDGGEHNNERFNAWKYRDYVIDAFQNDKPYNQFVMEQIAGDALSPDDPKIVAATGLLVAGPWDSVTKQINRDEIMRKTLRYDEFDDMITATFATFQALTVNCARCHDHKFDPIPTRDYYRLASVFNGVGFGERQIATPEQRAARQAAIAPIQSGLRRLQKEIAAIEGPVRARVLFAKYQAFERERENEPRRMPLNPVWNRNRFAPVTAAHFRMAILGASGGRARIDRFELLPAGRMVENWTAAASASPEKPVHLEIALDEPATVSEIQWSTDRKTAAGGGSISIYRFESSDDGANWRTVASSLDHIHDLEITIPRASDAEIAAGLSAEDLARRAALMKERDAVQAKLDAIPELETVYTVKPDEAMLERVLERGSLATPGEPVTPGTLSAIRTLSPDLEFDPKNEPSRRLALARWVADEKNPLTARVMVNRVWQYHFGAGIVNTPSDFGFNGDRPSHPELLDWLAVSFMQNGWSVKWLHRLILSSRAYQQSAAFNEKAHAIDAGNRLVWRIPLKRMDAETLRDSILAVAGNLNPQRGGPGFFLQKKVDRASYIHKAVDYDGPEVWRRAVYRFVARGGERVFMDSFDCPDPAVATPQRAATNTPVQALTLLNNRFVFGQAEALAKRLEREAGDSPRARVARAYLLLYGRAPNDRETAMGLRFLEKQPLAMYCRVLLNTNEFMYVP